MLEDLPSLNTLVLGNKTALALENNADPSYSELNTLGTWLNVGKGPQHSVNNPEGKYRWSSEELERHYTLLEGEDSSKEFEAETYVRLGKSVILYHYDESGNEIASPTVFRGPIGDDYIINADHVSGYTLKENQGPFTGTYDDTERSVDLIYVKKQEAPASNQSSIVIIHHQDENGNTIAPDKVLSGSIGDGYVTSAKEINGYILKKRKCHWSLL